MKTHGSAENVAPTAPRLGTVFETESRSIQVLQPTEFEVCFQIDRDVITIPLETTTCAVAYESDVVSDQTFFAGHLNYLPAGCRVYSRTKKAGATLIAFDVETYVRRGLEDELHNLFPSEATVNLNSQFIQPLIDGAKKLSQSGGLFGRLGIEELSLASLETVLDPRQTQFSGRTPPRLSERQLRSFLDFVDMCLMDDLDLTTLSDSVAMTPSEIVAAFGTATGTTLSGYVLERRIAVAMDLLKNNDLSVASIAEDVGLHCRDTLNKGFLLRVGVTPEAYRAQTLN